MVVVTSPPALSEGEGASNKIFHFIVPSPSERVRVRSEEQTKLY